MNKKCKVRIAAHAAILHFPIDAETHERRAVTFSPEFRADYRARLAAHTGRWRDACRRHAATFVDLTAEDDTTARIAALVAAGLLGTLR